VRHAITVDLETAASADGILLGRRATIVLDGGAYAADTPVMTEMTTMLAVGPYRIPHVLAEARSVYTNRTPAGSVRAPTGPQMCWAVEQHMDSLAERLGIDACELRRRNLVEAGDEGPTRQIYEHVGARDCLDRAAELAGWGDPVEDGEGLGIACGFWNTMTSPSGAHVRLNADGSGTIITGAQENGTGAVMALPLLAAEELGLRPEQFSIVAQDTAVAPWDHGSAGSQTTVNNGRAVVAAASEVRDQLLDLAEAELEIGRDDLVVANGVIAACGIPSRSVTVAALARIAQERGVSLWGTSIAAPFPRPDHDVSGCVGRFVLGAFSAPTFFCHAARVRVDRETGVVRVLEIAAAHDFGVVLNEAGAVGQVHGGVMHGIGMALLEGTVFDGGVQLNPGLLNYKLQVAADMPRVRIAFVEAPAADAGPRGAKGVGEPPMVPTAAAVANAIAAACGARVRRLPMTPERVWEASA
jgi:CO/xanthine dehydrogenase Mo-binding subunit